MWTPGYWAWNDDDGYYWVPGTWVMAPVGMFWTPGYWGWGGGLYMWHPGYWGPHVGFYGGINYGFGYTGMGFAGGEWRGRNFYYNRSVTNVSVTNVTNVYNRTVIVNNNNHVAFNGGNDGIQARPTHQEEVYAHERHTPALGMQADHERMASRDRQNFASMNHGRPAIAATARPGDFSRHSAVAARNAGGEYHAPAMSPREARVGGGQGNRGGSNNGFRSFTPPSRNGSPSANQRGGNSNFQNQRGNSNVQNNRGNPNVQNNRGNQGRYNESRPQNNSRPSARPNENAPRGNYQRQQGPPPRHEGPPPKEDHRGKGR